MTRALILLTAILLTAILLIACGGSGTGDPSGEHDRSIEPVHCLPEAPTCR